MSQTSAMMGGSFNSYRNNSSWDFDDYSSKPTFKKEKKEEKKLYTPKTTTTSTTLPNYPTSLKNTSSGDFAIHDISELSVGMMIQHSRFGEGVVENLDNSGADAKIRVHFTELQETKLLMLRFAKFKILK